mgnify:CR=1 FL=1
MGLLLVPFLLFFMQKLLATLALSSMALGLAGCDTASVLDDEYASSSSSSSRLTGTGLVITGTGTVMMSTSSSSSSLSL